MERKPKAEAKTHAGKINTRRTQRNEPCPCGRTKTISYPGTEFPDREVPVKFKRHCLNEMGHQTGNIVSTKVIIDNRNKIRFAK